MSPDKEDTAAAAAGAPPTERDGPVQRLAAGLRARRVTLLAGAAAARAACLRSRLRPQLARRAEDHGAPGPPATATRTSAPVAVERRQRFGAAAAPGALGAGGGAEALVWLERWPADPLAALRRAFDRAIERLGHRPERDATHSLASLAHLYHQRHGLRVMMVLDCFDSLLDQPPSEARRRFEDALADLLNRPLTPANVLIGVDDAADRRLDGWCARIPGFDAQVVDVAAIAADARDDPGPPAPGGTDAAAATLRREVADRAAAPPRSTGRSPLPPDSERSAGPPEAKQATAEPEQAARAAAADEPPTAVDAPPAAAVDPGATASSSLLAGTEVPYTPEPPAQRHASKPAKPAIDDVAGWSASLNEALNRAAALSRQDPWVDSADGPLRPARRAPSAVAPPAHVTRRVRSATWQASVGAAWASLTGGRRPDRAADRLAGHAGVAGSASVDRQAVDGRASAWAALAASAPTPARQPAAKSARMAAPARTAAPVGLSATAVATQTGPATRARSASSRAPPRIDPTMAAWPMPVEPAAPSFRGDEGLRDQAAAPRADGDRGLDADRHRAEAGTRQRRDDHAAPAAARSQRDAPARDRPPTRRRRRSLPIWGLVLLACAPLVVGGLAWQRWAGPVAPAAVAEPPTWRGVRATAPVAADPRASEPLERGPLASSAPAPVPETGRFDLVLDLEGEADVRLARELAQRVAPAAGVRLTLRPRIVEDALAAPPATGVPTLSIVRYDLLRAGAATGEAAARQLVLPLFTETMAFVARADAPTEALHQMKGLRLDAGPAGSPRALGAARVHERLFGAAPIGVAAPSLDTQAALERLAAGGLVDVVALTGADPAGQWAALPQALRASLKLLRFDARATGSARALQTYLPATLRLPDDVADATGAARATSTLGAMAFLVADGPVDPAAAQALGALAAALCRELPALQRDGHPKWRELRPGVTFDAGLPYLPQAAEAIRACQAAPAAPRGGTAASSTRPASASATMQAGQGEAPRHAPRHAPRASQEP